MSFEVVYTRHWTIWK